MKSLFAISILALTLVLTQTASASGGCSLALGVYGASPKAEIIYKLRDALQIELKKVNKANTIVIVSSPSEASDSDYFYLLTQKSGGFRVAVNNLLINDTFYSNEYYNGAFSSQNAVVKNLAIDFADDVLVNMKYCAK
jgi:hypothetical protein